jgi:hypothetical protein
MLFFQETMLLPLLRNNIAQDVASRRRMVYFFQQFIAYTWSHRTATPSPCSVSPSRRCLALLRPAILSVLVLTLLSGVLFSIALGRPALRGQPTPLDRLFRPVERLLDRWLGVRPQEEISGAGRAGPTNNDGSRGFTEILFAYASCMADNGQTLAGLGANSAVRVCLVHGRQRPDLGRASPCLT